MPKWVMNYGSGQYEWIEENGYSWTRGEFVFCWDNSEFEEEEQQNHFRNNWNNSFDWDEDDDW